MVISPVIGGLLLCTAAQAATVKGVVKNGTLDRLEPNVVVQLVYHSAQSAEVLSDTTDASGAFTFEVAGAGGSGGQGGASLGKSGGAGNQGTSADTNF